MRRNWLLLTIVLLSFGLFGTYQAEAQSNKKTLILAGYKLTPSVQTSGTGSLTLTLKNDTLTVEGSFSDLTAPYYSSGVYFTREDMAVNQLLKFDADLNEQHTGGTFKAENNRFHLSEALKEMYHNGELSIKIMSSEHKSGEIGIDIPGSS
ncbi:CHRD domain-containing protein [Aliifodinibius sp. S!AR15-10]|uniref:CHRD domain-containing protein n=1 Tax=Aliifodinibius sp. S!AR15-10 TaxID=2950437 RepID=UPI002858EB8E|nr:CHRD domain-containing protein [Aliifodinibius sp. S!AR15-10]MDR8393587.1 CHRD domain-containing protein [Aliifodinibius sp. S!AR15-10]